MDDGLGRGQRIARARRRRGLSQAALAGLAGRSESWLSQVERGQREVDSHSVLIRLAEVLCIAVTDLSGEDVSDHRASKFAAARQIESAMMAYQSLESVIRAERAACEPDLATLRTTMYRVNGSYQSARYDEAGKMLPGLIRSIETAARTCPSRDAAAVGALRSQVYQAAAMVLNRVDETSLAWTAGDRAVTAAEHAEAGLLAAVSAFRLAHVFIKRKHASPARDLVSDAASALRRSGRDDDPERLSVIGALHLAEALAAASDFDRAAASRALIAARQVAERIDTERNDHWTAFGQTNVRIHEISAAVAFGDADAAVETGEALDLGRLPAGLDGRRSQVSLDLARAYTQQRHDAAAVNMLILAEKTAPQLVRYDTATHDLLAMLLRREHRASTPQLRSLAHRAGVI
jgi:transcriptional regulator with XRE-family HTH domain